MKYTLLFARRTVAIAAVALAACNGDDEPSTPSEVTAVSPASVTGVAGEAVATPVTVRVAAQNGRPLSGVTVVFQVTSGGGSVNPPTALTDAAGQATATWTLGPRTGANTLTATVAGITAVTFTAQASAGAPRTVRASAGDNQTASVGTSVATRPAVVVADANGNPVPGVQVLFTVSAGNGTVTGERVATDAAGTAAVGSFTLGTTAGENRVTATVLGANIENNPIVFRATGTPGTPAAVTAVSATTLTGTVGGPLQTLPSVRVVDASGNAIPNATVTFAIENGEGTLGGATATTNAQGVATLSSFALGQRAGATTIVASATGATAVRFTVNATAGAPATVTIQGGNNQSARAGQAVATGPQVLVRDQFGNAVSGATVTFAVASGGGAVQGGTQTTNAQGLATAGAFTLGPTPGANTLTARVGTLTPVTFAATGLPGDPAFVTRVSAEAITVPTSSAAPEPFVVRVTDRDNFPIPGVTVTFAITTGTGTLSSREVTTDANGRASATFTSPNTAGTTQVIATVGSLPGVGFTVTTQPSVAARVAAFRGQSQSATVGTPVLVTPVVQVLDSRGNPVQGVVVEFAIASGGGGISRLEGLATTDAQGLADPGQWVLGTTPGLNRLRAVVLGVAGVAGNPVIFEAQGVTGTQGASTFTIFQGNGQSAPAGTAVPIAPAVLVRDGAGNPVAGVTVTFAVLSGTGTVTPTSVLTDASGIARASQWILSAGFNQLVAQVPATGAILSFTATGQ